MNLPWLKKQAPEPEKVDVPPSGPECPCPYCEKAYDDGYRRGKYDTEGGEEEKSK